MGDLIYTLDRTVCCKRRLQPLACFNKANSMRQKLELSLTGAYAFADPPLFYRDTFAIVRR